MFKTLPEPELLRQLLDYNPASGALVWRDRPSKRPNGMTSGHISSIGGKVAGSKNKSGHIVVSLNGIKYLAHRIAWSMSYGVKDFPEIDHINGDPCDNRIANLRCVAHAENQRNLKRRSDNKSGFVGVNLHKETGSWRAYINFDGKRRHIGLFRTKEEAALARMIEQEKLGFHPNHGR